MSFTEPAADDAQPEGQGDGGVTGGQPYADYLTRVPEEVRGDVEPIFKDWNSSVNRRFEEAAEYRKQWEPYEQAGVRNLTPEDIQWTMQLREAALNNPANLREWLDQTYGPAASPEKEAAAEQLYDQFDPQAQQLQQLLDSKLSPMQKQLEAFMQRQQEVEQKAQEAAISEQINLEIAKLREEHAKDLPKKVLEDLPKIIERYGKDYATPGASPQDVVRRAYADFEVLRGQLETGALQQKVDQPDAALSGETADGSVVAPRTMKEANALAAQQIRETIRAGGRI